MNKFTNALKAETTSSDYDATFIASTPANDRHQTTVPQENWVLDNFNANAIIGYNHNVWGDTGGQDPDSVIGKGNAFINAHGNLQLDVKFDDVSNNVTAEKVKAKVEGGFLKAVSVGFAEISEGKFVNTEGKEVMSSEAGAIYQYGQVELMEVSVVNLPANPEALVMSKNAEIESLQKEIKGFKKLKGEVKDIGETFRSVGDTMQIFSDTMTDGDWEVGTLTTIDQKDVVDYEDDKIEQLYKLRKRKARNRARRINL